MNRFKLKSEYNPRGDQGQAIDELVEGILAGEKHQTLLGVTGSGKTFTIANVIARVNRPAIIISPKTLHVLMQLTVMVRQRTILTAILVLMALV